MAIDTVTTAQRPAERAARSARKAARPLARKPSLDSFAKGMAAALAMLREAKNLADADDYSPDPYRWAREGAAQNRFALGHLRAVAANPAMAEGFSAVLSAYLAESMREGGPLNMDAFLSIPASEYMPGRPGDDGTQPPFDWDDVGAVAAPSCASQPAEVAASCGGSIPDEGRESRMRNVEAAQVAAPAMDLGDCQELGWALDRARVLLGILIERTTNGADDDDPRAMRENTITLADEALRHVLTAANLGGQLEKRELLATRKEVAHG